MLPPQEHIARRTVERAFRTRAASLEAWNALCLELDGAISPVFDKGKKLGGGDVDRLADSVVSHLARLDPVVLLDHRREPSRSRPKGEAREILCLAPHASGEEGKRFVELSVVRFVLTRKKAVIETSSTGIRFTEHAMRRAIIREVAEGGGIEGAFARQMLDHAGIVVLARSLLGRGELAYTDTLPLPFSEGLILGGFVKAPDSAFDRLVYNDQGRVRLPFPINPLLTDAPEQAPPSRADLPVYRASTMIGDNETTIVQLDLCHALRRFSARHREVINVLGEASLWGETLLRDIRRLPDVARPYEEARAALLALLRDPDLNGVRGGRPPEEPALPPGALAQPAAERPGALAS